MPTFPLFPQGWLARFRIDSLACLRSVSGMKKALVPFADGFEEMEGIIVVDVLRRAGFQVTTAGLHDGPVVAARQTRHLPDAVFDRIADEPFDLVVLPGGGKGAENLAAHAGLASFLKRMKLSGALVGAICAAPNVLLKHGLISAGDRFTLFPGTMTGSHAGTYLPDERVVVSGRIVTSKGPGTAFEFALTLVEILGGVELRRKVAAAMFVADT